MNDTDVFSYNAEFRDERRQVHINSIQSKETVRRVNCNVTCSRISSPSLFVRTAGRVESDSEQHRRRQETLHRCCDCTYHEGKKDSDTSTARSGYHRSCQRSLCTRREDNQGEDRTANRTGIHEKRRRSRERVCICSMSICSMEPMELDIALLAFMK